MVQARSVSYTEQDTSTVLPAKEELLAQVWTTFQRPDYQPPILPVVAVELMQLAQDPKTNFGHVSRLLEKDAFLAGNVLRIARSPAYAGRTTVVSLDQALTRLGLKTLRDIVLQVALTSRVFRAKPYQPLMESLSRHTTAAAHIAYVIAAHTAVETQSAFMCGLLHDVGIAGILISLSEHAGRSSPPPLASIWPAIESIHAEVSKVMSDRWGLPYDVGVAIGAHHQVVIEGQPDPMAAVLNLTEYLTDNLGFPLVALDQQQQCRAATATEPLAVTIDTLKLTDAGLEAVTEAAKTRLTGVGLGPT